MFQLLPSRPLASITTSVEHFLVLLCPAAAAAVRYFSEQLAGELGEDPSVQTIANLVATVSGTLATAQC
jgi:hypothetical protein